MARAMVEAAEADGRLRPGGSVVEYTGGSTGVSSRLCVRREANPSSDCDIGDIQQGEKGPHDGVGVLSSPWSVAQLVGRRRP